VNYDACLQAKYTARGRHPNLTTMTLLRLYWPVLLYHSFWVLCEVGIRWVLCEVKIVLSHHLR
jgi:hypothetical protein